MDRVGRIVCSSSEQETIDFGIELGRKLQPGGIVCLYGDLGAGKTTLIKGIVQAVVGTPPDEVCSPTYAYMVMYPGKCPLYHFDLYRLGGCDDFLSLGFDEFLFSNGISCLEWSERIAQILPADCLHVTLEHAGEGKRLITFEAL